MTGDYRTRQGIGAGYCGKACLQESALLQSQQHRNNPAHRLEEIRRLTPYTCLCLSDVPYGKGSKLK